MYLTPAAYVILIFGGVRQCAKHIGRTASSVSKWQTGSGLIPSQMQARILFKAQQLKLDLTEHDIIHGRKLDKYHEA